MGANRPPVAQSAPPMPVPGNLTNAGVTQPRPDAPHHQSSFGAVPDRAQTPSHPTPPEFLHVGTASPFPSGPGPAGPGPNRSQSPFVHNGPSPAHHAVGSPLVNGTGKGQQRPNGVSDQIPHQVAPNSQQGPPMPGLNMAHQLNNDCTDRGVVARTAVVDVLGRAMPDMRQGGKEGLAKTVAALIAVRSIMPQSVDLGAAPQADVTERAPLCRRPVGGLHPPLGRDARLIIARESQVGRYCVSSGSLEIRVRCRLSLNIADAMPRASRVSLDCPCRIICIICRLYCQEYPM